MSFLVRGAAAACFAIAASIATVVPACAQDAAQFYAGKTVSFLVGYGTGASYDTGARLLGRALARHIPVHNGSAVIETARHFLALKCVAKRHDHRIASSQLALRATAATALKAASPSAPIR